MTNGRRGCRRNLSPMIQIADAQRIAWINGVLCTGKTPTMSEINTLKTEMSGVMAMKTFDIHTDVTLECPRCRAYKTVDRTVELPAAVRLIEIICPDCDDGDRHADRWFSAPGVEVSQDDREPWRE